MLKTERELDRAMREMLGRARDGALPRGLSPEEMLCLQECVKRQYISGVTISTFEGRPTADYRAPGITREGLLFLENKHPGLKANIAIAISVLALALSIYNLLRGSG